MLVEIVKPKIEKNMKKPEIGLNEADSLARDCVSKLFNRDGLVVKFSGQNISLKRKIDEDVIVYSYGIGSGVNQIETKGDTILSSKDLKNVLNKYSGDLCLQYVITINGSDIIAYLLSENQKKTIDEQF